MSNCYEHSLNCIDELFDDHKKILKSLDDLAEGTKNSVNKNAVNDFLDFTRDFSEPHHQKEEKVLFPKLEEKGIPNEGGPIGIMLLEHEMKRKFVKGLSEALDDNNETKIKENASAIVSLMRDHIYKEDNILYPCAKDAISEEEMSEIGERCSKINKIRSNI